MNTYNDKLFGVFENGVLTELLSGDSSAYRKRAVVKDLPDDFNGWTGIRLQELDDTMHVKSIHQLVSEGLIVLDEFHKVVDGKIVDKTQIDLIKDGIQDPPEGYRLVDDALVPMTDEEKISAGLLVVPANMVFDEKLRTLRPMTTEERAVAGLDPILSGWKLDQETGMVRRMTELELYEEDPSSLQFGRVYDNGTIRAMTKAEIRKEAYNVDPVKGAKALRKLADKKFYTVLEEGFIFSNSVYQAGEDSIKSATSALVGIQNGMVALPIYWRARNNENITIATEEQFSALLAAMMLFYNQQLTRLWEVKDALTSSLANDFDRAYAILEAYLEE